MENSSDLFVSQPNNDNFVLNRTAVALLINQINFLQEEQEKCHKPLPVVCNDKPLYQMLMGKGFLFVFVLAIIGNCLNLFIYNSDQIRFYIAIRMLCTKLFKNTLMMVALLPQALRIIKFWEPGSKIDKFYWKFWPYQAYCVNVFGFCAMWLTVLMTAECYIHIFFPSRSKSICTKKNLSRSYVIIVVSGMILASIYIFNRTVQLEKQCDIFVVKIFASETFLMKVSEKIHTIANLLLSIMIPLFLLVFMTAAIVWRLLIRASDVSSTSRFSAEKKCVTRITLITTALQLITEIPSVPVFIYAALLGPNIVNKNAQLCNWQTISHFLGLCNASMSFFVYISFSERFRTSILRRAQLMFHECCPKLISRPINITKMRTYTSFMSHTNERSFENFTMRRPEMLNFSASPNLRTGNGINVRTEMQIVINSGSESQLVNMSHQILSPCTTPTNVHDSFL